MIGRYTSVSDYLLTICVSFDANAELKREAKPRPRSGLQYTPISISHSMSNCQNAMIIETAS